MIPFASQRGSGQDLATHLLNEHDNDFMEVAELRGAVASDLPGAFAEWEAQAHTLTKCKNYLYSMSINPDPKQGELTREQYMNFIQRTEERLGLTAQPRAIVFHIKEGREHCHVVWSRVDVYNEKAIHMAFDKDKLMMVTKEFARDHDLTLPKGYFKSGDENSSPLSLYELEQQRESGLTKQDHMKLVTEAWRSSDNAQVFIQALAENGYMLATGRRPYVLVDFYGGQHALPRMINDKSIRAKDVQEFLEEDYPSESLPSVDEAKKLIAVHRQSSESHLKNERRGEALSQLKQKQKVRREKLSLQKTEIKYEQHKQREKLEQEHKAARNLLKNDHREKTKQIKDERNKRIHGLADFLGKVSGINAIRKYVYRYQDRQRTMHLLKNMVDLKEKQRDETLSLQRSQEMQSLDLERQFRSLDRIDAKERESVEQALKCEVRYHARGGHTQMPSLGLKLTPRGRKAVPHKAIHRYVRPSTAKGEELEGGFERAEEGKTKQKQIDLEGEFNRVASEEEEGGKSSDGRAVGTDIKREEKIQRYGHRRGKDKDFDKER